MKHSVYVEDVMTPRRLLQHAATDVQAAELAENGQFDAIPLTGSDGRVREFWSRQEQRRVRLAKRYLTPHDTPLQEILPSLASQTVQFVHYRSEIVGLIDASDLNKPLARLAWLKPMLDLERAVLDAVRARGISDDDQAAALGGAAKKAMNRQKAAARDDMLLPLLDYVEFPILLTASNHFGITQLTGDEIKHLNDVRKRAAHAGDSVIEHRSDCSRIVAVLELATRARVRITPGRQTRANGSGRAGSKA